MSPDIISGYPKLRALLIGLLLVLTAATLLVYSPTLSGSPLFDESFLLAWLSHCIKSGLTASDTTAYLLAPAADPRDGLTALGAANILLSALFTGTGYSLMRFEQVLLHLFNSLLLFLAVLGATINDGHMHDRDGTGDLKQEEEQSQHQFIDSVSTRSITLAFVAALYFCLFPLGPEAVAWLFGLPVEIATTFALLATGILVWMDHLQMPSKGRLIAFVVAAALGIIAPWISLKAAFLVTLPIILVMVRNGVKNFFGEEQLRPVLISLALIILSSAPAAFLNLSERSVLPESIKQLTIEKIALTADSETSKNDFLESGPGANVQAIMLPVNRNIDERYNKVLRLLYLILPLPALLFLAAALTSPRFRWFGLATLAAFILSALTAGASINGQSFYGARWLYPVLPSACLFWAMLSVSPLFIETGKRLTANNETAERVIKSGLCLIFVFSLSIFFVQRTYRQNLSYRSNSKLWKVIKESIKIAGQQKTSPFIIVRNLPQSLSIAPILSPFSPQLIDTQSGLPRTKSLSGGRLKDALKTGKYADITLHYEKQYSIFAATNLAIVDKAFGPQLNAVQITEHLAPPIIYYNGTVKLDEKKENVLMESHARIGPALRLDCCGLSPVDGDFLFVEAKIDVPQGLRSNGPDGAAGNTAVLELHWLTNWQGDWEARDRRVQTSGPVSDGQYHRYYFPLRTLAWTTSGLPTNIMLGFPGGATVAIKSLGLCMEPVPLPEISLAPVHKQDTNKNYFSHYCFNYPDIDALGLSAVYGHDNALDINYDVSKIADAKEALIEIIALSEGFRNENGSSLLEGVGGLQLPANTIKGNIKVRAEQLGGSGLYSVRVFAVGADHKIIGHSSDSLKCLVDPRL